MRPGRFTAGFVVGAATLLAAAWLISAIDAVEVFVRPLLVPDSSGRADALVVPGAGVIGSECVPNLSGLRRTMAAVRLFDQGRAPLVVFTGGPGSRTSCVVGEAMASLARQLGLPREATLVETRSTTTWENAVFSAELLRPRGVHKILIVTDALHVPRCERVFKKVGFEVGSISVPVVQVCQTNLAMLGMALHEYLGLVYYRMRGYA